MKKINLKEISEILSEKELKNVMGGSGAPCSSYYYVCSDGVCPTYGGMKGQCVRGPGGNCTCGYVF